jgi:hypothetical protein
MPLKPGKSRKVVSENIREFHGGKTYRRTEAKFGKKKADAQAVAAAMSNARKGSTKTKSKAKPRPRRSSFWG